MELIRPLGQALSRLASDLYEFNDSNNEKQDCPIDYDHKSSCGPSGGIKRDVTRCYSANYSLGSYCSIKIKKKRITSSNLHRSPKQLAPATDSLVCNIESSNILALPLSQKHASWVTLQSIPRVSQLLHRKIKDIAADLQLSEIQHSDLKNKYVALQEKIKSTWLSNESGVNFISEIQVQPMNPGLDDEQRVKTVLDQTIHAISETPAELEKHFNRSVSPLAIRRIDGDNIKSAQNNIFTSRKSAIPTPSPFQGNSLNRSFDADYMQQMGRHVYTGSDISFQDEYDYGNEELNRMSEDSSSNSRVKRNIDLNIGPVTVSQVIPTGILVENGLSGEKYSLLSIEFELQKTQSALRLLKLEYDELAREIQSSRLNDENRKGSFFERECALRRDLEIATDLAESQNLLVVTLGAKVMLIFVICL